MLIHKIKKILTNLSESRNILSMEELPEAGLLPGIIEAAKRIIFLLTNGKKLLVVGDYDCDGINATAILIDFLRRAGFKDQVDYIIPDRFVDGYGVSNNMVKFAIDNYFDFIVTVDNGIGAKEAVKYATDNNIEVIITDHHTPGNAVPVVDIIVNPKYNKGNFPFEEISGATVAWLLCCQIREELNLEIDMRDWLDLVGITVISDVMPLKSLNVTFVRFAIDAIKNKKRLIYGLAFNASKRATLTEQDIAFGYVPMINAVGRIDHAKNAVELLLSNSKKIIKEKFSYMVDINNKRKFLNQELLNQVLPEAELQIKNGHNVIIVNQEDLHEGIVGILAGKLAEKFNVPAYVFGWNDAKQCFKGSGRTVGNIDLYSLTKTAEIHAQGFGGHKGAVGAAVHEKNFKKWVSSLRKSAKKLNPEDFKETGPKALDTTFSDINSELMSLLNEYRPFGQEFPLPTFKAKVFLNVLDSYKEGLHWKCLLIDENGKNLNAWFFHDKNIGDYNGQTVNISFQPVENRSSIGNEIQLHATLIM